MESCGQTIDVLGVFFNNTSAFLASHRGFGCLPFPTSDVTINCTVNFYYDEEAGAALVPGGVLLSKGGIDIVMMDFSNGSACDGYTFTNQPDGSGETIDFCNKTNQYVRALNHYAQITRNELKPLNSVKHKFDNVKYVVDYLKPLI